MKACYTVALSVLAGITVGGAAIQTLHAQATPPIFMIALNEVSNPEGYRKNYIPLARKTIKDHGGIFVAAGAGKQVTGNLPNGRIVILQWKSMDALRAWRNSPEYQAALKVGSKYAKYNIIAVPGIKR